MEYHTPLALSVISGIFLALGAVFAILVATDILIRKGWRSMMGIMIPVYIINAAYLGPLAVFLYFRFGRPSKPLPSIGRNPGTRLELDSASEVSDLESQRKDSACHEQPSCHLEKPASPTQSSEPPTVKGGCCHKKDRSVVESCSQTDTPNSSLSSPSAAPGCQSAPDKTQDLKPSGHHACHKSAQRPMWVTILAGVFHCGAGCVLGDLVGEWLVYGTDAKINGHMLWPELLIDYAFALLFGIIFQYFSIAPMSGQWGPMTFWRAFKADVVSLTSFEVGAFGWMIAFQAGIFHYQLMTDMWLYWWMMQVGMALGACTAFPVNYWLIKKGIKEPCC